MVTQRCGSRRHACRGETRSLWIFPFSSRASPRVRFCSLQHVLLCSTLLVCSGLLASVAAESAAGDSAPTNDAGKTSGTEGDAASTTYVLELVVEVVEKPAECTRKSENGKLLKVHYAGFFSNGTQFDASNRERGAPFVFQLGAGRVIKGWDQGLQDMCVGERRRLTVPPHLGYGQNGFGSVIGPNQVLTFDVELLDVNEPSQEAALFGFKELDLDTDGRLSRDEVKEYLRRMGLRMEEIAIQTETTEAVNKLLDKIMDIHDADRDGFLSEEEFHKPVSASQKKDEL